MKHLQFEYGTGLMNASLPDNTDVFIPGVTVPDPDYIPEDKLEEAYLNSIRNPVGMPPLSELAHKGSKVTIVFPDIVKGGLQPTSHRKMSIRIILNELYKKTRGYIYLYNIFAYNCIFVFNRLFFRKRNRSKCNRDNVFNNVLLPDYMLFYYIYLVYKVHRT